MDSSHPLVNGAEVIDGSFVSVKVRQVVDAIRDYSPELQVHWVPPATREKDQAAYRIVHFPVGKEPYIVCCVQNDEDMDERILRGIIAGDQRNGKKLLSEYEAAEEAARLINHQKFLDSLEEAHDMAAHAIRSRLHNYRINKDIVIRDHGGLC